MTPEGKLEEVTAPNDKEKVAQEMVLFAPRKVTLPPNQPQASRLSERTPEGLPDGELFLYAEADVAGSHRDVVRPGAADVRITLRREG